MVLNAFDIESSRLLRSLARFCKPAAVKKLTGLSSAVLTRLPVASLVCVAVIRSEVFCSCRRFARTPAERTISAPIEHSFLELLAHALGFWIPSDLRFF